MKLGYLICVHNHPDQLRRMIRALDQPNAFFYVHVDRRAPIEEFQKDMSHPSNIRFAPKRFNMNRKAWSHMLAWFELMEMAVRDSCAYYSLMSGSDYPIKSAMEIQDFFNKADQEFISYFQLEDRPDWKFKVMEYHYRDLNASIQTSTGLVRSVKEGELKLRRTLDNFRKPRRLPEMPIYGGSEWWSLSHDCVVHLLRISRENRTLMDFFRYTDAPHEMLFQTIVLNSPFRSRVIGISDYSAKPNWGNARHPWPTPELNLRYIDWSPERFTNHGYGSPSRGPAVLDDRDRENLRNSSSLFARKFHPTISKSLLDWIDRELVHIH